MKSQILRCMPISRSGTPVVMRLVVIGGDAAGATAASTVKRTHPDWDVVVFEMGPWTSYAACGFPYALGGLISPWEKLVARSAEEHRKRGLDVRIRTEVTTIDTKARRVTFRDHEAGTDGEEAYDKLVYATGAGEARPPIPGLEHGHFVQTPTQARRLGEALDDAEHVVIVGGGYIGLEMAESVRRRNKEAILIDAAQQVMLTLDSDMADLVKGALSEIGVHVMLGNPLSSIERHGDRFRVNTKQEAIDTDAVVLAMGSRPRNALARSAGIPLGKTGAVQVNRRMESPMDGIYAAGDCAEVWHLVKDDWANIHLGTVANKTGRIAGINVAGGNASFPGVLGTAVSKICHYEVARTGITEREADEIGREVRAAKIKSMTRAHYYPDAGAIHVKLLADARSGKLVGGQIVGKEGAAKRIDVVATAITTGLTAAQIVDLDLSYAPPYSPVWDPVQIAARQL
jgi:NADPH-dependent 2,4-dienoyl-CoA reductase/sulfur reductase-like enzyme